MSGERNSGVAAVHARLGTFLQKHPEESLFGNLARLIQDPLNPLTRNGRLRINPLLVILIAILLVAFGLFIFFSFGQS
jgi:hypothetical protein